MASTRKPRRERRSARSKRNPVAEPLMPSSDLVRLARVRAKELIVFPINGKSLNMAAMEYRLIGKAVDYKKKVEKLEASLADLGDDSLKTETGGVDEEAVASALEATLIHSPQTYPEYVLRLAEEVEPLLGSWGEIEALEGSTNFGILSGEGLELFDSPPINKLVLSLEDKRNRLSEGMTQSAYLAGRRGVGAWEESIPTQVIGTLRKEANKYGIFLLSGTLKDDLSLFPLMGGPLNYTSVLGLLQEVLGAGMWDFEKQQWAPGASVRFALPEDYAPKNQGEKTQAGILASYLCASTYSYVDDEGKTLDFAYAPDKTRLTGTYGGRPISATTVIIEKRPVTKIKGRGFQGELSFLGDGHGSAVIKESLPKAREIRLKPVYQDRRVCPNSLFTQDLFQVIEELLRSIKRDPFGYADFLISALNVAGNKALADALFDRVHLVQDLQKDEVYAKPIDLYLKAVESASGTRFQTSERSIPLSAFVFGPEGSGNAPSVSEGTLAAIEEAARRKESTFAVSDSADTITLGKKPGKKKLLLYAYEKAGRKGKRLICRAVTAQGKKEGQWLYSIGYGQERSPIVPLSHMKAYLNSAGKQLAVLSSSMEEARKDLRTQMVGLLGQLIRPDPEVKTMPIAQFPLGSFVGELPSPDGIFRYLPAISEDSNYLSWYGASDFLRAFAVNRVGMRQKLEGQRQEERIVGRGRFLRTCFPSSLYRLSWLAHLGQQRLPESPFILKNKKLIARLAEAAPQLDQASSFTKSAFNEASTPRDARKIEDQFWQAVQKKDCKPSRVVHIDPAYTSAREDCYLDSIFTVYGYLDSETLAFMGRTGQEARAKQIRTVAETDGYSPYGVLWQSPILTRGKIAAILAQERKRYGAEDQKSTKPGLPEPISLSFMKPLIPAVLAEEKTITVRPASTAKRVGLKPGEVGVTQVGGQPVFVRYRGPRTFDALIEEEGSVQNLANRNIAGAYNTITTAEEYSSILPTYGKFWVQGRGSLQIYDLSLSGDFPDVEIIREPFNPVAALRAWIARSSGLDQLTRMWLDLEKKEEKSLPMPYSIVGTVYIDQSKVPPNLPKSADIPGTKNIGMLLTSIYIDTMPRSSVPHLNALVSAGARPTAKTGVPIYGLTQNNIRSLSLHTLKTGWDKTRKKPLPLVGTSWEPPLFFSLKNVAASTAYSAPEYGAMARALMQNAQLDNPEPKEVVAIRAYYAVLEDKLKYSSTGGTSQALIEGRRSFYGMGGTQARARRTKDLYTAESARSKRWATEKAPYFTSIFSLATDICSNTGSCGAFGPRRTQIRALLSDVIFIPLSFTEDQLTAILVDEESEVLLTSDQAKIVTKKLDKSEVFWTRILSDMYEAHPEQTEEGMVLSLDLLDQETMESTNPIIGLMEQYGIDLPATGDIEGLKGALKELRDKMGLIYRHQTSTGLLPKQLEEVAAITGVGIALDDMTPEQLRLAAGAIGTGIDTDFALDYVDAIARANPGKHGRKPRKPRRTRRASRNPLDDSAVKEAVEFAKTGEKGNLDVAFSDLRRQDGGYREWPITQDRLSALFPRTGRVRDTWKPQERFQALTDFDLVSAARHPDLDEWATKRGKNPHAIRRALQQQELPFSDPEAMNYIANRVGLSLEEATKILAQQRASKGRATAMQASSALCKLHRHRRLTNYTLHPGMQKAGGKNKILILMSPTGALFPRVMTWRRNTHIDCDMVGKKPEDIGDMLAAAIQASLYWVAENPKRRAQNTDIYVGRIGDPLLYVAWQSGEPLTIGQVTQNLNRAVSREAPHLTVEAYEALPEEEQTEIERYYASVRSLLGPDKARTQEESKGNEEVPWEADGTPKTPEEGEETPLGTSEPDF